METAKYKLSKDKVLVLKTANCNGKTYLDFQYPKKGMVQCEDWIDNNRCGNGLHGALKGEGNGSLFSWDINAIWLVIEVNLSDIRDCDGKVKFPNGNVIYYGNRKKATRIIYETYHTAVIGGTATAGDEGTATVGDNGTATAGDEGTATAGDRGTAIARYRGTATAGDEGTAIAKYKGTATAGDEGKATAGYRGTAIVGYRSTAIAGDNGKATAGNEGIAIVGYKGTAIAGNKGTATAGNKGTATAGDEGTATVGYRGTATAGNKGTATAGNEGTATAGNGGTAAAGKKGILIIEYFHSGIRKKIGYIRKNGLCAGKKYKLNSDFKFIKVKTSV